MRKKIYNVLNKIYGVCMTVAFFAGVLPLIPFIIAIVIGGEAGEAISVFLYKQYYPWVILLASVSILIGLVAMYIAKIDGLSMKSFGKSEGAADEEKDGGAEQKPFKILFIASTLEKPNPSWHLMKALMEDVLDSGIKIHAIQRHFEDAPLPAFPENIMNHEGFSYSLVPSKTVDKKAFVKRYLEGMDYARRVRKYIKANDDFDMIFMQSSPTSYFMLGTARKFAKSRPVVFNSQDMFPGSAITSGVMRQKWMQSIFYAMQRHAYKKADIITAISEDMKVKLMKEGVPEEKIRVIVNWYDDTSVKEIPREENKFISEYALSDDKFYVQYAGTMGNVFNYRIILDVAQRLKEYPDIELQMIGGGVNKAPFEREAAERGLDNIVFYPLQPQERVADVYSACSVCLIPLKQGVIGNSVPSKAGLLMACGRVIVNSVDKDSDYYSIFEREGIGASAGTDEPDRVAELILRYYSDPQLTAECGRRAKEYGEKYYSRTYNTALYLELFKELYGK